MRRVALPIVLLLLAGPLAGCLDGDGGPGDGLGRGSTGAPGSAPHAPIQDTRDVEMAIDPLTTTMGAACETEASVCFHYPISLAEPARIDATLTWLNATNDFDLYLFQGDERVAVDGGFPPATEENLELELDPGEYRLRVVAWLVPEDTFSLEATFSLA